MLRKTRTEKGQVMTTINLNRTTISALPKGTEATIWDAELKGFGFLRRRAANGTTFDRFLIQYRYAGIQRKVTLNAHKVSLTQARDEARRVLAQVELGIDPQADEKANKAAAARMTFSAAVEMYLKAKAETLRPASLKVATRYLTSTRYFAFDKPVDDVTLSDVSARLDAISRDSGTVTASASRAHLSTFYVWAMQRGHASKNPVINTEAPKAKSKRERALSSDELRRVWQACGNDDYGRIVKLLILTGCRREEIGGLRWSEIDFDQGTLKIAAERSKNHREHVLPLSNKALNILRAIQRPGCEYVFGSGGFRTWGFAKARLGDGCAAWTLHDLRRTAATGMADLGVLPHTIEAVLNHVSGHKAGVAGVYNRSTYAKQMRDALAMWGDHVVSIVDGVPAKVVALPLAG
jgi:integrase